MEHWCTFGYTLDVGGDQHKFILALIGFFNSLEHFVKDTKAANGIQEVCEQVRSALTPLHGVDQLFLVMGHCHVLRVIHSFRCVSFLLNICILAILCCSCLIFERSISFCLVSSQAGAVQWNPVVIFIFPPEEFVSVFIGLVSVWIHYPIPDICHFKLGPLVLPFLDLHDRGGVPEAS